MEAKEYNIRTCPKCKNINGNIITTKQDGYKVVCGKCNVLIFEKDW